MTAHGISNNNALGKLPDKRYQLLDAQYAGEQSALEAEIRVLQDEVNKFEDSKKTSGKFIALVKRYQDFEELTTPMLIEFIDKICVHERDIKGVQDSPQTIDIYFNFIGEFSVSDKVDGPTPEEIELAERKQKLREKRHEQYLRRKSTGWQSTYYWKTKRAKKEKMDAMKEEIRAEDRANGVYYLPNKEKAEEIERKQEEQYDKTGTEDS